MTMAVATWRWFRWRSAIVLLALVASGAAAGATERCGPAPALDDAIEAPAPGSAEAYLAHALLLAGEARHDLALGDLDQAIRLDPTLLEARVQRGRAYAELDLHAQAIDDFSWVIARDPEDARAWLGRANAQRDAGDYGAALADYAQAIALRPDDADAWFQRAIAWHRLDRFDLEDADWLRAITLNPDLFWLYGVTYRHRILYEGLRSNQRTALRYPPDNAKAYLGRAEAHRYQRRPCLAIQDYTTALELQPGYADARLGRGIARHATGADVQAIEDLSAALERRPTAEAYYYRALAREALGEEQQAVDDLAAALQLSPFNPVIRAKSEQLHADP